jgi:hypothetical protein
VDINNDGKNDLIAGDSSGSVWMFLNTGTPEKPELAEGKKLEADGKVIQASRSGYKIENGKPVPIKPEKGLELAGDYSKLHVVDWDGDGLKDLLIDCSVINKDILVFYKNIGTPEACKFQAPVEMKCPAGNWPTRPAPYVVDLDGDGIQDLLMASEGTEVWFYRNLGTNKEPKLDKGQKLPLAGDGFDKAYRTRICVVDWNNDGILDILAGNITISKPNEQPGGNIWLFLGKKQP